MSKKKKGLTQKDFLVFKKWCEYYLKLFGLNYVSRNIEFVDVQDEDDVARTTSDYEFAHIRLNTNYHGMHPVDMRRVARHEVIHVILSEMDMLGRQRYSSASAMYNVVERTTSMLATIIGELEK